jgi:sec-independent protein translocase protein TatA
MGLGGISLWQLLIVLVIVIVIFGTKKLSGMGSDLGGAVKGFRKAMTDEENKADGDGDDPAQINQPDAEFSATDSASKAESDAKQNS